MVAFCTQKKQNNAACAAENPASEGSMEKIDVDLASHDTNHTLLISLENQVNSRIKTTVSRKL